MYALSIGRRGRECLSIGFSYAYAYTYRKCRRHFALKVRLDRNAIIDSARPGGQVGRPVCEGVPPFNCCRPDVDTLGIANPLRYCHPPSVDRHKDPESQSPYSTPEPARICFPTGGDSRWLGITQMWTLCLRGVDIRLFPDNQSLNFPLEGRISVVREVSGA